MIKRSYFLSVRIFGLIIAFAVISIYIQMQSRACDIAVVSSGASSNGRPFIWKSRDHSSNWQQEIRFYAGKNEFVGGNIRVIDRSELNLNIPSGGVNEAGFAITNTTVYESDPFHEYLGNDNHNLGIRALEECVTVEDFDDIIDRFNEICEDNYLQEMREFGERQLNWHHQFKEIIEIIKKS